MNILRNACIFIVCCCLFYPVKAKQQILSEDKQKENKSLLWKITGNEMKKPSYLFGTMHLICQDDYLWTSAMKKSLKASKEVCFEMDMDDPSVMMEAAMGMMDNSGKNFADYFTPQEYDLVEKFVKDSLGLSMEMLDKMKPAAVVSFFATASVSCAVPISYESKIMEDAKKMKLEITGLEEPKEQIALLDNMPIDSIIKEMISLTQDFSKEKNEYQKMVQAYRKQDISMLYELMERSEDGSINMGVFLDERNNKWIGRMEGRMDQKSVFFAVGAGHLWGENGLINLLRIKGYKVEAVR